MKTLYEDDDIRFYRVDSEGVTAVLENKSDYGIIVCIDGDDNDTGLDIGLKPYGWYNFGSELYVDWITDKLNNGDFVIDDI